MKIFLKYIQNTGILLIFKRFSFLLLVILFTLFFFFKLPLSDILATNVLTNPSFTGGTTGWSLTQISGGTIAFNPSIYQDSAGSLYSYTTVGRNTTVSNYASQTISSTIVGGSTVYLNLYWAKQCVALICTNNKIDVSITYSGTTNSVWADATIPAAGARTAWQQVSNYDISSYFTNTGTYDLTITYYLRNANNKSAQSLGWVDNMNLDVTPPTTTVTVGTTGTQVSSHYANTSNAYLGGAFTFVRSTSSTSVTSITVSETGTISDANISGLILYYKQEATCSTSIPGDATVFNSTPGSFSSGSSTVTGTMSVGTSQVCMYVEADVGSASAGNTIEIQITNPSTQITVGDGVVSPATAVAISGTTTIQTNTAPTFTNFSNNGPVNPGSNITFSATASDPDGNNITLVVCKTQGVTGTACDGGSGDTWCTSSAVASNPSCVYSVPSVYPDTTYNTYPYIFDSQNEPATGSYQGVLSTFSINNVAPTVSAVTINGGTSISLESGTTKAVTLTATVSDNNSCQDVSSVLGYAYRSGVGYVTDGGTYYLNASDATTSDPNAVWTNDANAFDGLTTTTAYTATQGSTSSNYLLGQGSNAPTTGDTISSVKARVYNDVSRGGAVAAPIYTNSLAELLGTPTHAGYQPGVGDYVDSNTVGYWKLDEASGSGAYLLDSSGNNYHGTPTSTTFETGKLGGGRGFSVTTSKISIGDLAAFEVGTFTIDAYIYKTGNCNYGFCTIFGKGSSGYEGFVFGTILRGANNVLHVRINDGGSGTTQILDGTTALSNNTWYHVAAVVNSSTHSMKLYLNGNLENSGTFTETIYYGATAVRIGNSNANEDIGFAGVLDEVRFSDIERTPTEISNYSSLVSELSVGDYVTLAAPSGGWTWTALNDLETKLYKSDSSTYAAAPAKVELEVTTGSGAGCSNSTDSNFNNCYPEITCTVDTGTCTSSTDASANYTCTTNIYYYADPTGTNTQYPLDTWMDTIKATDNNSETNALQVSVGVQMNMLEAMSITSSINYGTLSVQSGNDPLDRTTTSTPTGNVGLDHEIYGTDMCTDYPTCSASKILVANQKYALTASTSYSSATTLSTTPTPVYIDISKPTTGSPTTKNMWWGMYAPLNTSPGSYSGTINVTAVASNPSNW